MQIYPITIPGGSDTYVQYNDGGIFGGATGLTYNDGTSVTTATGMTVTSCAVLGANSAILQPAADSTTFFQVKNAAGSGVLTCDTTNRQVIAGYSSATYPFTIKSDDGTDSFQFYLDGAHPSTHPQIRWTDGNLTLKSAEGAAHDTVVWIKGLSNSNPGYYQCFDEDDTNLITVKCTYDYGYINVEGSSPDGLILQSGADVPVMCFQGAAEGETAEFQIYGRRTGDSKRSLEIGVGVDAADTASFDGLSNYLFDGIINAVGGFSDNGSVGIDTTFLDADGNTITVSGGIITAKTAP